jgi:hypothetical protein
VFVGPSDSTTPEIIFTTGGYTGAAQVDYAVVPHNEENPVPPPDYSAYTGDLSSVAATVIPELPDLPEPHKKQIFLKEGQTQGGVDVDHERGQPVKFVAVARSSGRAAYSPDGVTWTTSSSSVLPFRC